jgi:hypothetical protein
MEHVEQITGRARQPIEPGDDQDVALAKRIKRLGSRAGRVGDEAGQETATVAVLAI